MAKTDAKPIDTTELRRLLSEAGYHAEDATGYEHWPEWEPRVEEIDTDHIYEAFACSPNEWYPGDPGADADAALIAAAVNALGPLLDELERLRSEDKRLRLAIERIRKVAAFPDDREDIYTLCCSALKTTDPQTQTPG